MRVQVLRPFVLRRMVEAVAGELPGKREVVVRCAVGPYQAALNDMVREVPGRCVGGVGAADTPQHTTTTNTTTVM